MPNDCPPRSEWKPGIVIGFKKLISFYGRRGKYEYWHVECLQCGRVSLLEANGIKEGGMCIKCRLETSSYKVSIHVDCWRMQHDKSK